MNPYASSFAATGNSAASPQRTWAASEPNVGTAIARATKRLLVRSRGSWPIWVTAVGILCVGIVAWRLRNPPPYATKLVLRIAEGAANGSGEAQSSAAIRAFVLNVAFSRERVSKIAGRHIGSGTGRKSDTAEDVAEILDATTIAITENDFVEDRSPTDPPRSVRIHLTFRWSDADVCWTVANELAGLLVDSERGRRSRAIEKGEALAGVLGEASPPHPEGGGLDESSPSVMNVASGSRSVRAGVDSVLRESARAWLDQRSLQGNQSLRFEIVDFGRHPADQVQRPSALFGAVLSLFPVFLFAAALLAGAFDPRVLDVEDLNAMGIVVLGRARPAHRV